VAVATEHRALVALASPTQVAVVEAAENLVETELVVLVVVAL
jgi:hypothetical protein